MESNTVSRQQAVGEVRNMAFQFADMYYAFVKVLRDRYGDEEALDIARRVLFMRAKERAEKMIVKAGEEGVERTPENIHDMSDVSYLGWDPSFGVDTCPYGAAWNRRIKDDPEFIEMWKSLQDSSVEEIVDKVMSLKHWEYDFDQMAGAIIPNAPAPPLSPTGLQ